MNLHETKMLQTEADSELMARAKKGDESAFDQLVRRHWNAACRHAARILKTQVDAMDAAQEAFVRLHNNRHSYCTNAPFATWFLKIVRNAAIDQIQRRATRREYHHAFDAIELIETTSYEKPSPDDSFLVKESLIAIEGRWALLSPSERELLDRIMDGEPVTQIANEMNRHPTTIAERVSRIRKKLKGDAHDNE